MRPCPVVWKARTYFWTVPDKDEVDWQNVPYVNFNSDNEQVKLNANWHSNDNSNYSVPALREFS
ncbi:hypothetical protein EPO33_03490 [Patescibacteria group bacterium]|nr:MAG: hypothetical protein EPO33_03490 [Patescibacteria group bacterium]